MSLQKSTIDRIALRPEAPATTPRQPSRATAATRPPRPLARTAPARHPVAAPGPLPTERALRRAFGILERRSPEAGGWLAERLWFRLPRGADAATRAGRTPAGGEAFEVTWAQGVVRGRVYGDWGNPTAYLVHGWGGWWQQLSAHVAPLVEAGLCVVAFDAPSHGDSSPGAFGRRSTTFVEMAQALAAVVADFGRPTVVVTHSAGAMAALHALGLGVSPEAYVLLAPPPSATEMMVPFAASLGIGPKSCTAMARRVERRVGLPLASFDLLAMASDQPTLPSLLVVHDRDDREAPVRGAVELTDAWHDARLMLTKGLGHRRLMWDPAAVERTARFAAAAADRVRRSSR